MDYETREVTHAARKREPVSDIERPRKKAAFKPWRFRGRWLPSARWKKSKRVDGKWVETSYTQEQAREHGFLFIDEPPRPYGRYKQAEDALRAWDQAVRKGEKIAHAEYWVENTETKERIELE